MRTPVVYSKNLNNHIITKQMIADCLYSVNKRAKNWRDKERDIRENCRSSRYFYDKYNNEEKAREQKEKYYQQKDIMLSVLSPTCIHKECVGYERRRIYDYEPDYDKYLGNYVWENRYYDKDMEEFVYFGDIELKDCPIYHYYLFYDIGADHTFHTPIDEEDLSLYDLEIKEINHLCTTGKDIVDLLSTQFVSKVIALISSGNYVLEEVA